MDRVYRERTAISRGSRGGHPQGDPDRQVLRVPDPISIGVEDRRPASLAPEQAPSDRSQCVASTHHIGAWRMRRWPHRCARRGRAPTGAGRLARLDDDAVVVGAHPHRPAGGHEPDGEDRRDRDAEREVGDRRAQHDGDRPRCRWRPEPWGADPRRIEPWEMEPGARPGAGLDTHVDPRGLPQQWRAADRVGGHHAGGPAAPGDTADGERAAAARAAGGNPAHVAHEQLAARTEHEPAAIGRRGATPAAIAGQEGCGGRHCTRGAESPSMAAPTRADNARPVAVGVAMPAGASAAVSRPWTAGRAPRRPRSRPRSRWRHRRR
jgi:hypothetical protein